MQHLNMDAIGQQNIRKHHTSYFLILARRIDRSALYCITISPVFYLDQIDSE